MADFWTDRERDALDYIVIQAVVNGRTTERTISPGTAIIKGPDGRALEWQVQQGAGLSGARQVFRGLGLAEFSIEIKLHTVDDRAQYELWKSVVKPSPPGQPQKIFRIEHPVLVDRDILQCVFLNDPLLDPDGNVGWTVITYKCREWRKPLPTIAAPKEAINTAEKVLNDEYSAKIAAEGAAWKDVPKILKGELPPPQ